MNSQPDHHRDAHVLVGRLNAGWLLIDREPDPERKACLEDHWIVLVRQYEVACDGADHHADDRFAVEVLDGD